MRQIKLWTPLTLLTLSLLTLQACSEGLIEASDDENDSVSSTLTTSQRKTRSALIKQAASEKGFHNPVLLAGIAMAETNMAHCWSEAQWACQGPASSSCGGGPIIAGSGDGPCAIKQGGLGYFQFDSGTHTQTLATYGHDVLTIEGNTRHAVDYMIARVIRSEYISGVETRTQALNWINAVRPHNDKWALWLKTVTHYYNGCIPGQCSVYTQRYNKYLNNTLSIYNEFGEDFWYGGKTTPVEPPEPPAVDQGAMDLPWSCNQSFRVTQGHNTTFSHYGKGAWAWDFGINVGEPLLAVKDGVIRMVKSTSTRHGCSSTYANDANYVVLDFGDGTEALYLHLQAGSVTVKAGDRVKRGQVLGKVGMTGWVCGAHLHFQVQERCNSWWCQSVPDTFRTIGDPAYNQTVTSQNCGEVIDPVDPLNEPTGLSPESSTRIQNTQPVSLSWQRQNAAQSYDILMQYQDDAGQWVQYFQWDDRAQTTMDVHPQFENRNYRWQVRACNATGCSTWSDASTFTVGSPHPTTPTHATLTSPQANEHIRTQHVPVTWRAIEGATYNVKLEVKSGNAWNTYYTWKRSSTELTIWPVTKNAHYRVSIQTCINGQCGEFSSPTPFYYNP